MTCDASGRDDFPRFEIASVTTVVNRNSNVNVTLRIQRELSFPYPKIGDYVIFEQQTASTKPCASAR